MVLRYGELVPLVARHDKGWHTHVLAFARFSLIETAVVATNLNDSKVIFHFDMENLIPLFMKAYSPNTVIMVTDWLLEEPTQDYFFLREFLSMKKNFDLGPFKSIILGITLC